MTKKIISILALLLLMQACRISYTFNGAAIDYNVYKTLRIGNFPIRAPMVYAPLQPMFENKLTDTYTKQTRLQIIDSSNTDLSVEGEITGYTLTPQAVNEDAYASQTRLTITVRVKYTDHKNPNGSIDQSFSAFRDFDSSQMLTSVQDELCEQITDELVKLGVKGFWNFSHYDIASHHPEVAVENVHLSDSLMTLSYHINNLK